MAPNRFDKRWERLGFRSDYTILDGLNFIVARFFYLMDWAPPMAVVIYLIGMFSKQKRAPIHQIFRLSFWSSVLGYLFYYSWGGNQFGPRYYYEVYPFLALEFAAIIRSWWGINHVLLKNATLGILIANLLSSAYLFYKQERFFNPAFMERKALYDLAKKTIPKDSIVFIRGFLGHKLVLGEEDAVRNSPFLDGTILYAHDLKDQNQKLMDYYPDREYYLGAYDREQNIPVLTKIH